MIDDKVLADRRLVLDPVHDGRHVLRQVPNARLAKRAEEIAGYLGLPLEIVDVGLGELEERLAELVEA